MTPIDDPCHDLSSFAYETAYNHQYHLSDTYDLLAMAGEDVVKVRIVIDIVRGDALEDGQVAVEIAGNVYSACAYEMYGKRLKLIE